MIYLITYQERADGAPPPKGTRHGKLVVTTKPCVVVTRPEDLKSHIRQLIEKCNAHIDTIRVWRQTPVRVTRTEFSIDGLEGLED